MVRRAYSAAIVRAFILAPLLGFVGCNALFGIEEASLRPETSDASSDARDATTEDHATDTATDALADAVSDVETSTGDERVCSPTTSSCSGSELIVCNEQGTGTTRTPCPAGCDDQAGKCKKVVPANGLGTDYYGATVDWVATNGTTIDTGSGATQPSISNGVQALIATIAQPGGPEIAVFKFRSITIPAGVTIRAKGDRPLALLAATTVSIAGTLDVSSSYDKDCGAGANQRPCSPGVAATPNSDATTSTAWGCGASGASYGTIGGSGQNGWYQHCTAVTPISNACSNVTLVPLLGGGNGGDSVSSIGPMTRLLGGCGGGAVQIVGGTSIDIAGAITASGGGGGFEKYIEQASLFSQSADDFGGAGGGSGGAILLESPTVSLPGKLFVNGGGGSSGALASGATALPPAGQNGGLLTTVEISPSGTRINCGKGGIGASGNKPASAATGPTDSGCTSAGAGGGGAGRIRINDRSSTLTCQAASPFYPKISGVVTCGEVGVQ